MTAASTSSSSNKQQLRIRQRIITNPRMIPNNASAIQPVSSTAQTPAQSGNNRCSSSSSASTCSGSTSTTYKTVEGTDLDFASVGTGNSTPPSAKSAGSAGGSLCHQFPVLSQAVVSRMDVHGATIRQQLNNGAHRQQRVGCHSPSPYDVPGNGVEVGGPRGTSSGPAFLFLPPTNQLNTNQPCSFTSSVTTNAGNGSSISGGVNSSGNNNHHHCNVSSTPSSATPRTTMGNHVPPASLATQNNNIYSQSHAQYLASTAAKFPSNQLVVKPMPSTITATTAHCDGSNAAAAEKFLLQQQLKRMSQQQQQMTNSKPQNGNGLGLGQAHQILVHPPSRSGSGVYAVANHINVAGSAHQHLHFPTPLESQHLINGDNGASSSSQLPHHHQQHSQSKKLSHSDVGQAIKPHSHHHHHHHSRQNSNNNSHKRNGGQSSKSTEFPVLINGQLPQPSSTTTVVDYSAFPSSHVKANGHQPISSASVSVSTSRMSMPLVKGQTITAKEVTEAKEMNGNGSETPPNSSRRSSQKDHSIPRPTSAATKKVGFAKQAESAETIRSYSTVPSNGGDDVVVGNGGTSTGSQIVAIRMSAEAQKRCEFKVSGGSDFSHPAIIGKITIHGQNSMPIPLNEGDQLLKVNGQDVGQWTQSQVQEVLRDLKAGGGDIVLVIKPNVYRCCSVLVDDEQEENLVCLSSRSQQPNSNGAEHVLDNVPRSEKLSFSLKMLKDALDSGKVAKQFDQLYRKKPGMSMDHSKLPANIGKNRYRDVCPYDATRVVLEGSPNGDYINACHVRMEIPTSGIVNRYIATQGPLANTTADFWHMVWEQSANTIAMLTTLLEKGRVKCHQYWPGQPGETMELEGSPLQITHIGERVEQHCHYRELSIRHKLTKEERLVTQMQYLAWPDHGVPENPQHFIEFVNEVRSARNGSMDPLIVHCSAGIGRTGVLILMETAACQIEANEPVYPFDSMRLMRDQRAMLIQTSEQYTFVCESILKAYNEQSVKPLAEYQKCR